MQHLPNSLVGSKADDHQATLSNTQRTAVSPTSSHFNSHPLSSHARSSDLVQSTHDARTRLDSVHHLPSPALETEILHDETHNPGDGCPIADVGKFLSQQAVAASKSVADLDKPSSLDERRPTVMTDKLQGRSEVAKMATSRNTPNDILLVDTDRNKAGDQCRSEGVLKVIRTGSTNEDAEKNPPLGENERSHMIRRIQNRK